MPLLQEFKKHILIIATIGAFFLILVLYLYVSNLEKDKANIYEYFPNNPIFILQVNHPENLREVLDEKTIYWNSLKGFNGIKELEVFENAINFLASSSLSKEFNALSKRKLSLGLYEFGKEEYEYLLAINTKEQYSSQEIREIITEKIPSLKHKANREYEGNIICNIEINEHSYYYAAFENFVFFSKSSLLLEAIIRKKNPLYNLYNEEGFRELLEKSDRNADANIFMHYENTIPYLKRFSEKSTKKMLDIVSNFAQWTYGDISFRKKRILLFGLTNADKENKNFSHVFKKEESQPNRFIKYMPKNTFSFLFYGFNDYNSLKLAFNTYLENNDSKYDFQNSISDVSKRYKGLDVEQKLGAIIEKSMGLFSVDWENKKGIGVTNYMIFQPKDIRKAIENIEEVAISVSEIKNSKINRASFSGHLIQTLNFKGIYKILLGEPFSFLKENYVTVIDDYMIIAESMNALVNLITSYKEKKTLLDQPDFRRAYSEISDESNIGFYIRFPYALNTIYTQTTKKFETVMRAKSKLFNHAPIIYTEFQSTSSGFSTALVIDFFDYQTQTSHTDYEWKQKIGSGFLTQPFVIYNHKIGEKVILLQNSDHELLMIRSNGSIIKRIQVKEEIEGKIYPIRAYGPQKIQLLFGTKNFIYGYDMNGNSLPGFPIRLESPASAPISVLDYDKKRNYRIFVGLKNGKIKLYDAKGKKRSGWQLPKVETNLIRPVQFFSYKRKSYLFFCEKNGKIHVLNRLGKEVLQINRKFDWSKNNLFYFDKNEKNWVTTDAYGNIVRVLPDGTIRTGKLAKLTEEHFFKLDNFNANRTPDYFISDYNSFTVYEKSKKLFHESFNQIITTPPLIFQFSKEKKYGVSSSESNIAFLYTPNGALEKNFPIYGSSAFSIKDVIPKNNAFEFFIAGNDGNLYMYLVPE